MTKYQIRKIFIKLQKSCYGVLKKVQLHACSATVPGTLWVEHWLTSWHISGAGGIQPQECRSSCYRWCHANVILKTTSWFNIACAVCDHWGIFEHHFKEKSIKQITNMVPGAIFHHSRAIFALGALSCRVKLRSWISLFLLLGWLVGGLTAANPKFYL